MCNLEKYKVEERGFTLVELLATIVIIALISLLIIPNISNILSDTKSSSYDVQISTIERAAQKYAVQNNIKLPNTGKKGYISVRDLITKGELNDSQIKNPITGTNLNGGVLIEYDSNNNQYTYTYVEDINLDASSLLGPTYIVEREHEYTTSKNVAIIYPEGYSDYEFKLLEGTIMLGEQRITGPSDWIASNTLRQNLVFITNGSLTSRVGDALEYKNGDTLVISTVDTTAPTVVLGYDEEKSTTNKSYIYATCSDPESGVHKYEFRLLPNGNWIDNGLNNSYVFTELNENQEYSYEARCTNGAGMIGVGSFNSLTQPMDTPTFIVESPGIWQHDKDVTIKYPSGYSRYEYKILDGKVTNGDGTLLPLNTWIVASNENEVVNFTTNGSVVARVFDGVSYKTSNQNVSYVDGVNPTAGTLTMKLGSQSGENYINDTWTNQSVYIALNNGTDDLSGHLLTTYSINGGEKLSGSMTLTSTGTYEIVVTTTDNALNTSSRSYIIKIDKNKPTIAFSPNGGRYILSGNDTTMNVSSKVTVQKQDSNIKLLQYAWSNSNTTAPSSWNKFTNEETLSKTVGIGDNYLWINAVDNAGNSVTVSSASFYVMRTIQAPINSLCVARSYTGKEQQLTSVTSGTGYTLSGYNQTNAGTYTVTATLLPGYIWSDNTTGTKSFQCSISKVTPVITLSSTSGTVLEGKTIQFTEKANVAGKFTNTSSNTSKLTVSAPTSEIAANTNSTVTLTGVKEGTSVVTVSFVPTDTTNYNNAENKIYNATILAPAVIPTNSLCVAKTYTGGEQQLTSATSGTGYTLSGYNQTNAGTYTITATLLPGYVWSDNTTGTKSFQCSMSKATPVITLSSTSGYVGLNGGSFTEKANVAGKFTNTSSNTNRLTASASTSEVAANTNSTVTLGIKGNASATVTVTVGFTPTDTKNYNNASSKTYTATIDAYAPTLSVAVSDGTTYASSHTATITISDSGGSGLPNTSVRIYYAWGTSSQSCSSMSKYVTITPSSGATSATANVYISTSTYGYGSGSIYICNKNAAIKDRANNSLAQSSVRSAYMYLGHKYSDGYIVYFNPNTGAKCTNYTSSQSNTGVNSGCMKWYVVNDDYRSSTVNLLLDHNISSACNKNVSTISTVINQLRSDTSSWTGVITHPTTTTSYHYYDQGPGGNVDYTIPYNYSKARLLSASEISDQTVSFIRANLTYGGNNGYWLSSADNNGSQQYITCYNSSCSNVKISGPSMTTCLYIRPVIEVSKSKL